MSGLHTAIINARMSHIKSFLAVGMKVNNRDELGRTPIMVACFMKNVKRRQVVCQQLLDYGADVQVLDKFKRTVLMYACATRNVFLLDKLLEFTDEDLNQTDKEGNTCLMYAAIEGDLQVLHKLLQPYLAYGVTLDVANKRGFTAYLLALKNGNVECARLLQENGASASIFDLQNYWNGEQWLESHYCERMCRESMQSKGIERARSQALRQEDNRIVQLLQRPRSMPPMFTMQTHDRTSNIYTQKAAAQRMPYTATMNVDVVCLRGESKNEGISRLPQQKSGRSSQNRNVINKSSKRAKTKAHAKESAAEQQQSESIGDYDVILRPQTGCSFRSETISAVGKSDYCDSVSVSTRERPSSRMQKEQLVKIFEEYSLNQVPIPPATPKKIEKIERKKGARGSDAMRQMSGISERLKTQRLSMVKSKVKDIRAEIRTILTMKSLKNPTQK